MGYLQNLKNEIFNKKRKFGEKKKDDISGSVFFPTFFTTGIVLSILILLLERIFDVYKKRKNSKKKVRIINILERTNNLLRVKRKRGENIFLKTI